VTAAGELVFVPHVGFRLAHALGTRANLVIERDGHLLAAAVTPDRDGCRLRLTVSGIAMDAGTEGRRLDLPVRIRDDRGREIASRPRSSGGGWIVRAADGSGTLRYGIALEPLAPGTRHLAVAFDGPAGVWKVELPVEPAYPAAAPAHHVDVHDAKHGVTLAARAVTRSDEFTAIELEASLDPVPEPGSSRRVRGIGPSIGGRLCGDQLVMRDDTGRVVFERGHPPPLIDPAGDRHREVAVFPRLAAKAGSGVIEIPVMWVREARDEIATVPVPGEADVRFAGFGAHVIVSRMPGVYTAGRIRVEVAGLLDPDAERQLVFIEGLETASGGGQLGGGTSHAMGQRPIVEVPEPSGTAHEVSLRGPVIQLRGPWRLEIPFA
jgi:hypothetical protein